jgi:hypothetical protein
VGPILLILIMIHFKTNTRQNGDRTTLCFLSNLTRNFTIALHLMRHVGDGYATATLTRITTVRALLEISVLSSAWSRITKEVNRTCQTKEQILSECHWKEYDCLGVEKDHKRRIHIGGARNIHAYHSSNDLSSSHEEYDNKSSWGLELGTPKMQCFCVESEIYQLSIVKKVFYCQ